MQVRDLRIRLTITAMAVDHDAEGEVIQKPIVFDYDRAFSNGLGDGQLDQLWYDSARTLSASPLTLDLAGGVKEPGGDTMTMGELAILCVHNTSAMDNHRLDIGGVTNGITGGTAGFSSTADKIKIGPGGLFVLISPEDGQGIAITAGTGDILKVDPGTSTITSRILLAGRSS